MKLQHCLYTKAFILRSITLLWMLQLHLLTSCQAQSDAVRSTVTIMPLPAKTEVTNDHFWLKEKFVIAANGPEGKTVNTAVKQFQERLTKQTKNTVKTTVFKKDSKPDLLLTFQQPATLQLNENEAYQLKVTSGQIHLSASSEAGIRHGLETLFQLIQQDAKSGKYFIAGVNIEDQPRFAWRGLLIDAARHFIPVEVLKRNLDAMALLKLNVLHWHLSDDQAFRVESKTFPKLHQLASGGEYYTQQQVKEIIDYAAERGIRVVPEFDMPGHATSWLVAYPELASNDSVYQLPERWGILNIAMDPTKESTYQFMEKFLAEMTALFPDPYFHIGGDENDGRQWKKNARIQAFMKANNLANPHALQQHFNKRISKMLVKNGKKMIGWDEILSPELPAVTVIQSWRGKKTLYKAAQNGFPAIMSYGYYLDLNYSAATHYNHDPLPENNPLSEKERQLILGGEAAMWAEFSDAALLDSKIWPRGAAVAERFWSPAAVTDVKDMYRRLAVMSDQLEFIGLTHRSYPEQLFKQMAGNSDPASVKVLASAIEPVKDYKRHFQGMKYTTKTPLNRLVDAAKPESDEAREFKEIIDEYLASIENPEDKQDAKRIIFLKTEAEKKLTNWQQNHEKFTQLVTQNPKLSEYQPLSDQLTTVSNIGLEALKYLETDRKPSADWLAEKLKQLEAAKKPHGQAMLVIIEPVIQLCKAAAKSNK